MAIFVVVPVPEFVFLSHRTLSEYGLGHKVLGCSRYFTVLQSLQGSLASGHVGTTDFPTHCWVAGCFSRQFTVYLPSIVVCPWLGKKITVPRLATSRCRGFTPSSSRLRIGFNKSIREARMNRGEIYCATSPSGKKYVGQCVQILASGKPWGMERRWRAHISSSKTVKPEQCRVLCHAIRKYGAESFKVERLCECDISELNEREAAYIKELNTFTPNGYNLTTGGDSNSRHSEETKRLRSVTMTGMVHHYRHNRKREEDKDLPKYLCSYVRRNSPGYVVHKHPTLRKRYWTSSKMTMAEKLALALAYLETA